MAKLSKIAESTVPKEKYAVKNWPAYNQGLIKRGSLTLWVSDDVLEKWYHEGISKRGGQYVYSDDCIRMVLTLKVVFRLGFRQMEGLARSIFQLMQIDLAVPSYTQVCRRQNGLKVPLNLSPSLKDGHGVHLVIDSSGLKIYGECEWKVRKHGYAKRRTWRKIHLGVDEASGEITAQVLTENDVDDACVLPELIRQTFENGVNIDKVGVDGAYDTFEIWDMLTELEIEAIIPPRENAVYQLDKKGNPTEHPRNAVLEIIDQGGVEANRAGWKKQAGYHRRSLSETTFFRWKTILGERMYARKFHNQTTEAAVKSAVLNRFIQIAKPVAVKKAA